MAALEELDPGSRALLDLSIRRGIRDEDLAELLRTAPSEVARKRTHAIERVAAEVGSSRPEELPEVRIALAELPPESWAGQRPKPPAAVTAPPSAPRLSPRRILIPLAAVGLVLAVLVVAGAYHGGNKSSAPKPRPAAPLGAPARLAPVMGGSARGTARISGNRLELSVSGLRPKAHYEAWLYGSVADAVPVASLRGPSARVHARLPKATGSRRFLDISLEPPDGNPNHSGQSVLRAPLASLRQ